MEKAKKSLKERLKNGEMVLGVWNSIPSATLVDVIGSTDVDFIIIDAEHGPVEMETAEELVRAADATKTPTIIRVTTNQEHLILRALDIGAHGVQIPHVTNRVEAQQAAESAKYHPEGHRGFSPFTRAGNYGRQADGYTKRANQQTLVIINIEGKKGADNLEEIASLPGIDVIFIGPYDLSQSLGKPGQVRDAQVINVIRRSVDIAERCGIACGSFACDQSYLELLIDCGVRYLTYMVDTALIRQTYQDVCNFFHGCAKKKVSP